MTRQRIHALIALVLLSIVAFAPAASAQEQEAPGADDTVEFSPGEEPAVVISDEEAAGDDYAWTFRYLVPTLLALTGLILAAVVLFYGIGVKGRYRVAK